MRALFIVNPHATTTTPRMRNVMVQTLGGDLDLDVEHTRYRGHARELARGGVIEGYELILTLGGDGTVNEAVNGIMAAPEGVARPRFAAVPGGSANVFTRALGVPADPIEATETILKALRQGTLRTIGLGGADDGESLRYFTFSAGLGWDAEVVHAVEEQRANGRKASPALYIRMAMRVLLRGTDRKNPLLSVDFPGEPPVSGLFVAIATNTTPWTYAGRWAMQPTPRSRFESGLDCFGLTQLKAWTTANLFRLMMSRSGVPPSGNGFLSRHDQPEFVMRAQQALAFQIDGEYLGPRKQINFYSISKALRIVC